VLVIVLAIANRVYGSIDRQSARHPDSEQTLRDSSSLDLFVQYRDDTVSFPT
jgi:hypothetical protein